ncbi:hypothetical protein [Parapedobacter indicus]|uniref:Uncharacterized protein n=1 Tax=Parapedobacter indicus TaxID=1477437 RepID=A0A1I3FFJ1_9SPHI|nr:hypothetical protein [Parapedobacter indicus]PPL03702.1 hypothetical protein CLV26_102310 [Parapedobacter indicus]SFI10003.1 hypothetical protein SAMN05444682_102310 [Parapedobacter indicus]
MARTIGIILIIIGIVMLVWTGFSFTREEKVVDIGALEISADKKEQVNWPPYVGGVILVAGVVLVLVPRRK